MPAETAWACSSSALEGDYGAQPVVAQIEPTPQHQTEIHAEQHVAEQRVADAQMAGDGAGGQCTWRSATPTYT